jgi:hypothetical protein
MENIRFSIFFVLYYFFKILNVEVETSKFMYENV